MSYIVSYLDYSRSSENREQETFDPIQSTIQSYSNLTHLTSNRYQIDGGFQFQTQQATTKVIESLASLSIRVYINRSYSVIVPSQNIRVEYYVNENGGIEVSGSFWVEIEEDETIEVIEEEIGSITFWVVESKLVPFGEAQCNEANLNLVLDGTKDSIKLDVFSYSKEPLEPNSFVQMTLPFLQNKLEYPNGNIWFCVESDKVERFLNEQKYDEELGEYVGETYWYKHTLRLLDAVQEFNARDLTDSGYYQNNYTFKTFIEKLFKMSNIYRDFANVNIVSLNNVELNMNIEYIKSYSNYTLLSALTDFLNGYNMKPVLSFDYNTTTRDTTMILYIVRKSGDFNLDTLDESVFNEVDEEWTLKRKNYAGKVVSNAENVISAKAKTYPSVGAIKLGSTAFKVEANSTTARLKLPSNIFKVNYVKAYPTISIALFSGGGILDGKTSLAYFTFNAANPLSVLKAYNDMLNFMINGDADHNPLPQEVINSFSDSKDIVIKRLTEIGTITYYGGMRVYPVSTSGTNLADPSPKPDGYYQVIMHNIGAQDYYHVISVLEKQERDTLANVNHAFFYEKGKNYLEGFTFLNNTIEGPGYPDIKSGNYTDLVNDSSISTSDKDDMVLWQYLNGSNYYRLALGTTIYSNRIRLNVIGTLFSVNYIPCGDIKIEYENDNKSNHIDLYNQTSKLTDSKAFSRMLDSYSKEIENGEIQKNGVYYLGQTIPQIGQYVELSDGKEYTINNASYTLYQNENDTMIIYGSFSLNRKVSTKSTLTEPNTDIRDYGIPQNNNVKRKQIYKDVYAFGYTQDNGTYYGRTYLTVYQIINYTNFYSPYKEHTAMIHITSGSNNWYYQLPTTTYYLHKCFVESVDFGDNNIIGYDVQNTETPFDKTKLVNTDWRAVNTPIGYVDGQGKFDGITLVYLTDDVLVNLYDQYMREESLSTTYPIYNSTVLIPQALYEKAYRTGGSFMITELEYKKDPIEVPVFEYLVQLKDSEEVIIGDNILVNEEDDMVYMYVATSNQHNTIDNERPNSEYISDVVKSTNQSGESILTTSACGASFGFEDIEGSGGEDFVIRFYPNGLIYNIDKNEMESGESSTYTGYYLDGDLAIYRIAVKKGTTYDTQQRVNDKRVDLYMVLKGKGAGGEYIILYPQHK